jgi:hypothetical protein
MKIYVLMYIDSIALSKKRTSLLSIRESAVLPAEIDGKPHHQSREPDVIDLDDADL